MRKTNPASKYELRIKPIGKPNLAHCILDTTIFLKTLVYLKWEAAPGSHHRLFYGGSFKKENIEKGHGLIVPVR